MEEKSENNRVLFAEKENRLRSKAAILDSYFMIINEGLECYTRYKDTGQVNTTLKHKWLLGIRSLMAQIKSEEKAFFEKNKNILDNISQDLDQLYEFSLELIILPTVESMRELSKEEIDPIEKYRNTAYK